MMTYTLILYLQKLTKRFMQIIIGKISKFSFKFLLNHNINLKSLFKSI